MARRSQLHLHLREVCALASPSPSPSPSPLDLSDPSLLAALHPRHHSLALASPSSSKPLILVLASASPRLTRIAPSLRESHGLLAALEWVPAPSSSSSSDPDDDPPPPVLAVGTTAGYLLFYSLRGDLIHRQSLYPAPILSLKFRDTSSPELSVVFPGLIARFDASHIQAMLQKCSHQASKMRLHQENEQYDDDDDSSFSNLPFQLWNLNKFGSCADAAIVALMPPPLLELQSSQRYYCAVTIGHDAVISAYRLSEDRSRSLVGAILSKVGTATISTISSFSSILWRREPSPTKKARPKPQAFAKDPTDISLSILTILVASLPLPSQPQASALTCVKDPPRKGERLTLSPSGTLAAVTDSLGRILLLDTQALVVVRLWKGYRDAHCLFVEMLAKKDKSTTSSNYYGYSKNDYCLCLAIHAPRKGIIEIWQMRTGPRLLTIQCPKGSKMLQPSIRSSSSDSSYNPLEVYLLNGDTGQLFVLNRHIS